MAVKNFILLILCSSTLAIASEKEEFRGILKGFLQQDPQFKEFDFQTPYYEAQLKQGFSQLLLPKVNLSYGLYEQHNNISAANSASRYRIGSLSASFNVFSFGSDWSFYQATRHERRAQIERVSLQLMRREEEVAKLLLDYLKSTRNIDILMRLVEMKGRALDVSRRRYERGALSQQDHQKVELDVSNARAELLVAQQDFNALMARVHAYGIEKLPSTYPWEKELTLPKIKEIESLEAKVEDLPQFKEVNHTLEATDYRANAALGDLFGDVRLDFSRNMFQFPNQDDQYEWRTALVYTLPLFAGFTQYTELQRTKALRNAYEVRQRFERLLAQRQQDAQKSNLQVSWKNWVERREALKISSKLYQGSLNQFNQGQLSVNELLVDQDRLLRTEQIANSAIHQLHGTVLNFCHSRGKAFVRGCF